MHFERGRHRLLFHDNNGAYYLEYFRKFFLNVGEALFSYSLMEVKNHLFVYRGNGADRPLFRIMTRV